MELRDVLTILIVTCLPINPSKTVSNITQTKRKDEATILDYNCPCGLREIDEEEERKCKESAMWEDKSEQENVRVVGGCESGKVPWYTLFLMRKGADKIRCGGAVINKFWVLSAAHCFCNSYFSCERKADEVQKMQAMKPTYNFTQIIDIYIGISLMPANGNEFAFKPLEIIIHPHYQASVQSNLREDYDFALVRLDYPIGDPVTGMGILQFGKFSQTTINPVCLPSNDLFDDVNKLGISVGMGLQGNKGVCITDGNGPEVFARCSNKWRSYRNDGKWNEGDFFTAKIFRPYGGEAAFNCEKTKPPPSSWDPVCTQFNNQIQSIKTKFEKKETLQPHEKTLLQEYNITKEALLLSSKEIMKKTAKGNHCFSTDVDSVNGWCVTCISNATEGKPGFCSENRDAMESEINEPKPSLGWGFCHEYCSARSVYVQKLQMIKMTILGDSLCKDFGNRPATKLDRPLVVNTNVELCGAFINSLNISLFNYTKQGHGFKFHALDRKDPKITERNSMFRSSRLDNDAAATQISQIRKKLMKEKSLIIGGTDTCQGDSGGPLWILRNESMKHENGTAEDVRKAYLVGVVSRGRGCAHSSYPGIYGRVKRILRWIRKFTLKPYKYKFKPIKNMQQVSAVTGKALVTTDTKLIYPYCTNVKVIKENMKTAKKGKKVKPKKRKRKCKRGKKCSKKTRRRSRKRKRRSRKP